MDADALAGTYASHLFELPGIDNYGLETPEANTLARALTDIKECEVVFWTYFFVNAKAGFLRSRARQDGLAYTAFMIYTLISAIAFAYHHKAYPSRCSFPIIVVSSHCLKDSRLEIHVPTYKATLEAYSSRAF